MSPGRRTAVIAVAGIVVLAAAWWGWRSQAGRSAAEPAAGPAEGPVAPIPMQAAEGPREVPIPRREKVHPTSSPRAVAPAPGSDPPRAPVLDTQPLTAGDRDILDRFMAQMEEGFRSPARELHRRLREEPADPAWSPFATGTIEASMQARLPELADLRFDPPVCRTSICVLRAVAGTGAGDHGMRWQAVMQGLMNEPWWREHFDDAQTSMGMVDGQQVYLTYFFVRDGQ